jgi:hypothetical protein
VMWARASRSRRDQRSIILPGKDCRAALDRAGEDTCPYMVGSDPRARATSFLHADVFDVRRDVPLVAECVFHSSAAVPIGVVGKFGD